MMRISIVSGLLLIASGLVADRAEAAWPPARPDLQVMDMWTTPRLPKAGQPVTFTVRSTAVPRRTSTS